MGVPPGIAIRYILKLAITPGDSDKEYYKLLFSGDCTFKGLGIKPGIQYHVPVAYSVAYLLFQISTSTVLAFEGIRASYLVHIYLLAMATMILLAAMKTFYHGKRGFRL